MQPHPIAATSLSVHGSGQCPVCAHPFTTSSDRVPGVEAQVSHADAACLDHLATHSPRELAFALLVTDAKLGMARLVIDAVPANLDRYEGHIGHLAADKRAELLE